MNTEKKEFFLKLHPPRATFMMDMNDEERSIMHQHVQYWSTLLERGIAIVYGPVLDPKGGFGAGVVTVNSEEELTKLIDNDPANGLNRYEYYPMKAVYRRV